MVGSTMARPCRCAHGRRSQAIAEFGYKGIEADLWIGLLAPARTPQERVSELANWFAAALKAPDLKGCVELVSEGGRAGQRQCSIQSWGDVRQAGGRPTGLRGCDELVSQGGRAGLRQCSIQSWSHVRHGPGCPAGLCH